MKKPHIAFIKAVLLLFTAIIIVSCKKELNSKPDNVSAKRDDITAGPVAMTGEPTVVRLRTGGQVFLYKKDDKYFMDGDIQMSSKQIEWLQTHKAGNTVTTFTTFKTDFVTLWPNKIIYYKISSTSLRPLILQAISHWQSNTIMQFVERTSQSNYVDFVDGTNNPGAAGESSLGMVGGRQTIALASDATFGVVVHEIGHTVGLYHEQSRADRDQYVNINWSNINSNFTSQYQTYLDRGLKGSEYGPYDYNSVMGYSSYYESVAKNGSTAWQITRKDDPSIRIYQGTYLSPGDIKGVELIYTPYYIVYDVQDQSSYYDGFTDVRESEVSMYFFKDAAHQQPGLPRNLRFTIIKTHDEADANGYMQHYTLQFTPTGAGETTTYMYLGHESQNMHYNQRMDLEPGSYSESLGITNLQ